MHIKRFTTNKFLPDQRNPTIVTFNPRALDLTPFIAPDDDAAAAEVQREPAVYDLVANVTYEGVKVRDDSVEGEAERKVWKVQMKEGGEGGSWWEMQDLFVERVNAELLSAKESYVMFWERRRSKKKGKAS